MEKYSNLLFYEILKAKDLGKLLVLEDDLNIAISLEDINDCMEIKLCKLALQSRYSYLYFKEILTELEKTNQSYGLVEKYEEEIEKKTNLILINN
jgi:hypothetical protein